MLPGATERRERVADSFKNLLITRPANILWLTGAKYEESYLWLRSGQWQLVVAEGTTPVQTDIDVVTYHAAKPGQHAKTINDAWRILSTLVRGPACVDTLDVSFGLWRALGQIPLTGAEHELAELRQVKCVDELNLIENNTKLLSLAMADAAAQVQPGRRESDVWAALATRLMSEAGQEVELHGNLGSGYRAAEADPHATTRQIATGEPVLLDAYPYLSGYATDLTRTWFCGQPNPMLVRAYDAVRASLEAVERRLRPGAVGSELDAVAKKALETAGLPPFAHHTGHGFGVNQQERPWLVAGSADVLKPGMVVAVEPGCYFPGVGGIRLEQAYVIDEDGARSMGSELPSVEAAIRS